MKIEINVITLSNNMKHKIIILLLVLVFSIISYEPFMVNAQQMNLIVITRPTDDA